MDTLNDLLAASDLVSLHCALTNETVQILNAECLQHIKPGICIFMTWDSSLPQVLWVTFFFSIFSCFWCGTTFSFFTIHILQGHLL